MTALPRGAEAAIAAVLVVSMVRAFFGRPPRRSDAVAAAGWMLAGLMLLGTVLLAGADARPRGVLTAAAVEAVCVAGWWLRGLREDGGGGADGADGEGDGGPPPPDWDDFDRRRESWSRPRELA
jgi:hypothetical protein